MYICVSIGTNAAVHSDEIVSIATTKAAVVRGTRLLPMIDDDDDGATRSACTRQRATNQMNSIVLDRAWFSMIDMMNESRVIQLSILCIACVYSRRMGRGQAAS